MDFLIHGAVDLRVTRKRGSQSWRRVDGSDLTFRKGLGMSTVEIWWDPQLYLRLQQIRK